MKLRFKNILWLALALIFARATFVAAQSVPGATDYSAFSQFISSRNIFDPNRYPHTPRTRPRPRVIYNSKSAPTFSLVGTMSYGKGLFAFFDGNNSDLKKILKENGEIAGYTVTKILPTTVTLQTADKKQIELRVGDLMRQEDGHWESAGQGIVPSGESSSVSTSSETAPTANNNSAPPTTGNSANDEILKRLMQKREQEK